MKILNSLIRIKRNKMEEATSRNSCTADLDAEELDKAEVWCGEKRWRRWSVSGERIWGVKGSGLPPTTTITRSVVPRRRAWCALSCRHTDGYTQDWTFCSVIPENTTPETPVASRPKIVLFFISTLNKRK